MATPFEPVTLADVKNAIGPSLVTKMLDGPASARRDALQAEILAKITEILRELQKQNMGVGQGETVSGPSRVDGETNESADGK